MSAHIPFEHAMIFAASSFSSASRASSCAGRGLHPPFPEIMLNAAGCLCHRGARFASADGQVISSLSWGGGRRGLHRSCNVLWLYHWQRNVDIDKASSLRG